MQSIPQLQQRYAKYANVPLPEPVLRMLIQMHLGCRLFRPPFRPDPVEENNWSLLSPNQREATMLNFEDSRDVALPICGLLIGKGYIVPKASIVDQSNGWEEWIPTTAGTAELFR